MEMNLSLKYDTKPLHNMKSMRISSPYVLFQSRYTLKSEVIYTPTDTVGPGVPPWRVGGKAVRQTLIYNTQNPDR